MDLEDEKLKLPPFIDSNSTPPIEQLDRVRASLQSDDVASSSTFPLDNSLIRKINNSPTILLTSHDTSPIDLQGTAIDLNSLKITFSAGSPKGRRASLNNQDLSSATKEDTRTSHINYRDPESSEEENEERRTPKRARRTLAFKLDGPSYVSPHHSNVNRNAASSSYSSNSRNLVQSANNVNSATLSLPSSAPLDTQIIWSAEELVVLQTYVNHCKATNERKKDWVSFLKEHQWVKKSSRQLATKACSMKATPSIKSGMLPAQDVKNTTEVIVIDSNDDIDEDVPEVKGKVSHALVQASTSEPTTRVGKGGKPFFTPTQTAILQKYVDECALEGVARNWIAFQKAYPTFERSAKQLSAKANVIGISPAVVIERAKRIEALRVQVATRRAEEIESQDRLESNISNAVSAPAFASGSAISGASNVSSASSFTSIDSTTKPVYLLEIPPFRPLVNTTSNASASNVLLPTPSTKNTDEEVSTEKPWSISELKDLKRLVATVDELGFGRDWRTIAHELNTGRKLNEVKVKWKSFETLKKGVEKKEVAKVSNKEFEIIKTNTSWSTKEVTSLLAETALQLFSSPTIDWRKIAYALGGTKDVYQCRSKWYEMRAKESENRARIVSNQIKSTATIKEIVPPVSPTIPVFQAPTSLALPAPYSPISPPSSSKVNTSAFNNPRMTSVPLIPVYSTPTSFLYPTSKATGISAYSALSNALPSTSSSSSNTAFTPTKTHVDYKTISRSGTSSTSASSLDRSSSYNSESHSNILSTITSQSNLTRQPPTIEHSTSRGITKPHLPQLAEVPSSPSSFTGPSSLLFPPSAPSSNVNSIASLDSPVSSLQSSFPPSIRLPQPASLLKRDPGISIPTSTILENPISKNPVTTAVIPSSSPSNIFRLSTQAASTTLPPSIKVSRLPSGLASRLAKKSTLSSPSINQLPISTVVPSITAASTRASNSVADAIGIQSISSTAQPVVSLKEAQAAMNKLLSMDWDD